VSIPTKKSDLSTQQDKEILGLGKFTRNSAAQSELHNSKVQKLSATGQQHFGPNDPD